ncbi:MAG TPA: hypothetical protein VGB55_07750, partial [Tepidisphaeraceae bacterium]
HTDLRPNSFLVDKNRLLFAEAAALVSGGLKTEHLWQLAHNAEPFATRADRLRVWASLVPEADLPHVDKRKMARYADNLRNDAVVPITIGAWSGTYRQRSIDAVPWSIASGMAIDSSQWLQAWPRLVERLAADRLDVLKRDRSGDVLAGQIELGEHLIDVIVKRPRNKFWYRYVLDCFRASRGRRTFDRTRQLQIRHLPVEYPLIVMERRVGGYVVESVDVFERVPGETLEQINLDRLTAKDRADLFFACGRLLRRIEETGLSHPDAKSSNWIVYFLPSGRPVPVLIDAYGVRPLRNSSQLKGIQRLLRAMRNHPQYTPDDSLQLCLGFAPRAKPEAAREN